MKLTILKTMKKNPEIEEKNERKITIHNKDNINPDETERQKKLRKRAFTNS